MSKNNVYSLKSFVIKNDTPVLDGYLLFPNEEKGDTFLKMANLSNNYWGPKSYYEKNEFVQVNDFIFQKFNENKSFFVRSLKD